MDMHDVAQILGMLLASGAGCYFGLKGALNGIKDRTVRIEAAQGRQEATLADVRDISRDTHFEVVEARRKIEALASH